MRQGLSRRTALFVCCGSFSLSFLMFVGFLLVGLLASPSLPAPRDTPRETEAQAAPMQSIIVELSALPSVSVARDHALRSRVAFDVTAHRGAVLGSQSTFLGKLQTMGIPFRVSETPLRSAAGTIRKANHFAHLINAVGIEVPADQVEAIRKMPEVRHLTLDEPVTLNQDHSIQYVRANDGPGNKTIFTQAGGPLTRYDGAGQVIAVLDTGIDHSHPMFDTRFSDADYLQRTGDVRPVRLPGQPYQDGVNHPKVVYFLPLTGTSNEDDVGHGTHGASEAAGLKVKGPGVDRIPGNTDDQIIEGVAPGALLMNYKICETVFTCVGSANIVLALEDALSPTDLAGFPKPVATVINMSFGGGGSPNDASAVAASNAALAGAVPVASAGNEGPNENTHGAPGAGRRVIGVAACNDPGSSLNETDVLVADALRYTLAAVSTGGQNDAGRPVAPEDVPLNTVIMGGAPDVTFPLGQHYVYVGFADTPEQVPDSVQGRIALALRGGTVDADAGGTGLFGHKAAEVAAKGGIAILILNNVPGELEAATTQASVIPAYGLSQASGEYLRDALGFQSPDFDKDDLSTWGTISNFPIRINPPNPLTFTPSTTGFSSRGPVDNYQYLKPDVIAPGLNVYGATILAGGVGIGIGVPPAVGGTMSDPSRYISASGTSFSGPTVAGAAALIRQALLGLRGETALGGATLRSGAAASNQLAQFDVAPMSLVRAALTNTATNLRQGDGVTPVTDTDARTFIHEIGSGLIHVVEAVDARAAMGTNDANGLTGPDDANEPDFLPTHSFGQLAVINTDDPTQVSTVTVTLQNVSGSSAAGDYSLSLLDGGALRGDVTRPIAGTMGFSVALSSPSVTLGSTANDQATFDVTVTVDGRPAPIGLAIANSDDNGAQATEFLWWVIAAGSNGETLRMPFYYRASGEGAPPPAAPAPFQNAIADDATPDQLGGIDRDGDYVLSWSYPPAPTEQACAFQIEEATSFGTSMSDDAEEQLTLGDNSTWDGDNTWTTQPHPDTGTNSYSPLYIDAQNTSLTLIAPVSLPIGLSILSYDSLEDVEEDFDFLFVEVSADGGPFISLASFTGSFSGRREIDISEFGGQDIVVRFRLVSDDIQSFPLFQGWFIDNIEIETANFTTIATVGASTREFDITDRPNGNYYYRIAGLYDDPCTTVGDYSNVRDISVADPPPCGDPSFDGVQSVSAPPLATCTLDLAWDDAVTFCDCPSEGPAVTYNVYRSTNSAFEPSLESLIAVDVDALSYRDQAGLDHGTTYYYIVRAEDCQTTSDGPAHGGLEDDNVARLSGTPVGEATPAADFSDDVEPTSELGYTSTNTRTTGSWAVTPDLTAHSPNNAWVALDEQPGAPSGTQKDARLMLPAQNLTSSSTMSFWHNFDFAQFALSSEYHSGGVIEMSADGVTWTDLGPYITSGGYNGTVAAAALCPLAGQTAWVGSSDSGPSNVGTRIDAMTQVVIDLGAAIAAEFAATQTFGTQIRFRLGGTFQVLIGGVQGTGWGVDDIQITGLQAAGACLTQTCGDGIVDAGEECDAGAFNSDTEPDSCREDCTAPACGDGVVDSGERCDDGAANSDTEPDACRTDCSAAHCGDSVVDSNEACDNGAGNSDTQPNACRTNCALPACGDGVVDTGEACDDGAANSNTEPDACRTSCTLPACGDGVVDSEEECDNAGLNSDTVPDACRTDCALPACGDEVIDTGEQCDDGNVEVADGCSDACEIELVQPAPDPTEPDKNRFVAFSLPAAPPGLSTAIRVRLTSLHHPASVPSGTPDFSAHEGGYRYANSFGGNLECPDTPFMGTSYKCATLGCQPEYRDWGSELAGATLFITGNAVVPSSVVHVSQIAPVCGSAPQADSCLLSSGQLALSTAVWGDVAGPGSSDPDGVANVIDIGVIVDKLKSVPGALSEPQCWLKHQNPNPMADAVHVVDIGHTVDAVKGLAYPENLMMTACP